MKSRIALWTLVGALVVIGWTLYASASFPEQLAGNKALWTLIYVTCPIALARHYSLSFYFVLLVNAATYALVGLLVETIRLRVPVRQLSH